MTPAEIPGEHAADDATVAAWIAAAQAEIDGPGGWLGRAIGPQTLELRADSFWPWGNIKLPYPPIIEIVSLVYLDESDAEQTVAGADYGLAGQLFYPKSTFSAPTVGPDYEGVRVRYRAGYDGGATGSPHGTTGDVPAPIKQWIIHRVGQLRSMAPGADAPIRSETTVDLDAVTYAVATPTEISASYDVLLSPYQVYS